MGTILFTHGKRGGPGKFIHRSCMMHISNMSVHFCVKLQVLFSTLRET